MGTESDPIPTAPPPSTIIAPTSWTQRLPLDDLFGRRQRVEVDVGCGKGRFLLARARANHDVNYLGIDRLLRRLRKVDKKTLREGLDNVRLLRIEASYAVLHLLPPQSVSAIYIFFPDPWPKKRHHRRRLFNAAFLDALHGVLVDGGDVHVATDHLAYFEDIRCLFCEDERFGPIPSLEPTEEEQTEFERIFLAKGETIGRCAFRKTP